MGESDARRDLEGKKLDREHQECEGEENPPSPGGTEKEQEEKQSKADSIAKARQQVEDNDKRSEANAKDVRKAQESGEDESLKKEHDKETFEHLADSTNVKLDGLSTLFEQINNTIDWKEYLNG